MKETSILFKTEQYRHCLKYVLFISEWRPCDEGFRPFTLDFHGAADVLQHVNRHYNMFNCIGKTTCDLCAVKWLRNKETKKKKKQLSWFEENWFFYVWAMPWEQHRSLMHRCDTDVTSCDWSKITSSSTSSFCLSWFSGCTHIYSFFFTAVISVKGTFVQRYSSSHWLAAQWHRNHTAY